jgi:hypothetical protein
LILVSGCSGDTAPTPKTQQAPVPALTSNESKAAPSATDSFQVEDGFTALGLVDFESFQGEATTWREENGMIITTGKPKGYVHSARPFGNFTWRGEFRFVPVEGETDPKKSEQSNTGFMLCIQEPHKVWPRSLEVQGKFVELAQIKSNGGVPALVIMDDPAARESARKPVGEWNAVEIVCREGAVSATLNGTLICRSEPGELKEGRIGLQAENFAVEFRRLRIREGE